MCLPVVDKRMENLYNNTIGYSKGEFPMYKYAVWIRIDEYRTINTVIWASNDLDAKLVAESQYGQGNVLNWTRIDE